MNLSIKDYKEYSQLYTPIEIELKMADNRYVKFINIPPKEKEYYHIYFDNSTKEIKRNDLNRKDKVKVINIKIDHQITSLGELFSECEYISSIIFKKFYRTNIINMGSMFAQCFALEELNLSNFNTKNVTDMGLMFDRCWKLNKLNISNFNTSNVTNMNSMFCN